MTVSIFIMLVAIFAIISSFLTEAIKKWYDNANKKYSANVIALINAAVIGGGGTSIAYLIMDIPFSLINITYIVVMIGVTWMGSMLGYDKVKQLIAQVMAIKG